MHVAVCVCSEHELKNVFLLLLVGVGSAVSCFCCKWLNDDCCVDLCLLVCVCEFVGWFEKTHTPDFKAHNSQPQHKVRVFVGEHSNCCCRCFAQRHTTATITQTQMVLLVLLFTHNSNRFFFSFEFKNSKIHTQAGCWTDVRSVCVPVCVRGCVRNVVYL